MDESKMEIVQTESGVAINEELCERIVTLERQAEEIEAQQKEIKQKLREAMEKFGVKKIDNSWLAITYVAEHDTEKFDSKTFKAENPDIYDSYVKITKTSPSVRIKLK